MLAGFGASDDDDDDDDEDDDDDDDDDDAAGGGRKSVFASAEDFEHLLDGTADAVHPEEVPLL